MSDAPKVLIVDDEPGVRLVFRAALEAAGYTALEAGDGEEALEFVRATPVDLILLDLRMPLLDGMGTLRHLRDVGDLTPVIIVTAHGGVPDAVAALRLGAVDFLQKPLTPETLRSAVSDVIGRHREAEAPAGCAPVLTKHDLSAEKLAAARRALNRLEFDEAEFLLGQALDLEPRSGEAARLAAVLRESRREHQGPYRILRGPLP